MPSPSPSPKRRALYEVIFEARTPAGRAFDAILIATILASVIVVMLESVPAIQARHGPFLVGLEWFFTILFTIEYVVRLAVVARPRRYATSFFGVVDLLAVVPTYLSLLVPGTQVFLVIRLLRILRVFHVFEFTQAAGAADVLTSALRDARYPIGVFLAALATVVTLLGATMHLVEGPAAGFTSIPVGIYWAVVTLTTLGYGDLVPQTPLGRGLTTGIVVLGYWVLAVPVGIISMAIANATREQARRTGMVCSGCGLDEHDPDSRYCRSCGRSLQ